MSNIEKRNPTERMGTNSTVEVGQWYWIKEEGEKEWFGCTTHAHARACRHTTNKERRFKMKTADVCSKTLRPEGKRTEGKLYYYNTVGKAFINPDGRVDIKLHAVPINWNGELTIFFDKEEEEPT